MSKQHITRKRTSKLATPATESIAYYLDSFILHQRSQRHSDWSLRFYRWNIERFIWFLEQEHYPTQLAAITPNHIRHFFIYLQEEKGGRWGKQDGKTSKPLRPATIHAFARALRAFFRWATQEAHLEHNPFANVEMPKLPDAWKVQTYTDEEIITLFAACDKMGGPYMIQRNRTMLAILLDSGVRASELLGLQVADVDMQEGIFTVTGKGSKSRPVVIGSFARRELWIYLTQHRRKIESRETALFLSKDGTPLGYYGLKETFNRIRKLTGIDRVQVKAHNCRHTFATKAHRNGMRGSTLQEMLGHTKFDTTRRYYLDISKEDLATEHALYGPLDNMGSSLKQAHTTSAGGREAAQELPPAEQLAKEVAKSNYRAVAHKYGVSDTTIRNRIRQAGLL